MKKHLFNWFIGFLVTLFINLFPISAFSQDIVPIPPDTLDFPFDSSQWDFFDCPFTSGVSPSSGSSNVNYFEPPLALKTRFPFDLIYPISPFSLNPESQCLKTSLWGIERDFCTPMQVAKIAKSVFLLKVVLESLYSL